VAAEIEQRFAGLGAELHSWPAVAASLQRSGAWVAKNPMVQSWFEDHAASGAAHHADDAVHPALPADRW
jgi:hypothetical protein